MEVIKQFFFFSTDIVSRSAKQFEFGKKKSNMQYTVVGSYSEIKLA